MTNGESGQSAVPCRITQNTWEGSLLLAGMGKSYDYEAFESIDYLE